jgi:hypothetical protein
MTVPTPAAGTATPRVSGVEDLFEEDEPVAEESGEPGFSVIGDPGSTVSQEVILCPPVSGTPASADDPAEEQDPDEGDTREESTEEPDEEDKAGSDDEEASEDEDDASEDDEADAEDEVESEDDEAEAGDEEDEDAHGSPVTPAAGIAFNRAQWFDLLKWAHHSGALSQEQRLQIVRMGRLIQRGRRLTWKQDEQVREMLGLVHSLGYRFS